MKSKKKNFYTPEGFFLSVVEEAVMNPDYAGYIGGRVEVYDNHSPYNIEEVRFFTRKTEEFYKFREEIDFKQVSYKELQEIKQHIRQEFYEKVK